MNEGVHHPAAAVVEMPLDGRARSFRIAPLDRIHDRVVLAARRLLERGIVDAEGDEPRHLVETMPDEVRNDRVAAGLGHREMERAVRLGGVAEAGGVPAGVLARGELAQPGDRGRVRELRCPRRRGAFEEPADLEDVLDQRDGDGSDEVTAARDALDVAFFDEPRESFANGRSAGTQLAGKLRFTQGRAGRANPVHDAVLDLDVDLLASARLDTLRVRAVYGSCQARRWTKSFNK